MRKTRGKCAVKSGRACSSLLLAGVGDLYGVDMSMTENVRLYFVLLFFAVFISTEMSACAHNESKLR
jgi:hypothetical protein